MKLHSYIEKLYVYLIQNLHYYITYSASNLTDRLYLPPPSLSSHGSLSSLSSLSYSPLSVFPFNDLFPANNSQAKLQPDRRVKSATRYEGVGGEEGC